MRSFKLPKCLIFFSTKILPIIAIAVLLSGCGGTDANVVGDVNSGSGSITLAWTAPTTKADGSPLTDLDGYKLYYGMSTGQYTKTLNVGNFTSCSIDKLSEGTWYFTITAYDSNGNQSEFSNEISINIPYGI